MPNSAYASVGPISGGSNHRHTCIVHYTTRTSGKHVKKRSQKCSEIWKGVWNKITKGKDKVDLDFSGTCFRNIDRWSYVSSSLLLKFFPWRFSNASWIPVSITSLQSRLLNLAGSWMLWAVATIYTYFATTRWVLPLMEYAHTFFTQINFWLSILDVQNCIFDVTSPFNTD